MKVCFLQVSEWAVAFHLWMNNSSNIVI